MNRVSDAIETLDEAPKEEVLNQDDVIKSDIGPAVSSKVNGDNTSVPRNDNTENTNSNTEFCEVDLDEIDPFTNKVVLSKCQMLQICICSITIAPIRLLFTVLILLFMWFLVRIGLLCLSDEKLKTKPHTGWRKGIQKMLYGLGKVVCFCCGFYDITIVGERCSYEDAPLLIAAPHSTIFDIIAIVDSHSVPVSKDGVMKIPIIGVLGRFLQVIFVSRDNKDSRKVVGDTINMRAEMKERRRSLLKRSSQRIRSQLSKVSIGSVKSPNSIPVPKEKDEVKASWPQTILFPEGTVTNGRALIKFKSGAFYPGVAVQPILLRPRAVKDDSSASGYRQVGLDTLTWTMYQNFSPFTCMWLTLCQFRNRFVVEYLPVYQPNQEERQNPKLFAANVRTKMAAHLSVPLASVGLEDRFYKTKKDEDRIANKNDTSKDKDGDTEIELLNVSEGDKNDNSKGAIDAANSESKHKSDSPPLLPGSHPTMDFSGTINYI